MYESKPAQGLALGASGYLAVIRVHAAALRQVFRRDFDTCSRKTHLSVSFPFPHSLTSAHTCLSSFPSSLPSASAHLSVLQFPGKVPGKGSSLGALLGEKTYGPPSPDASQLTTDESSLSSVFLP